MKLVASHIASSEIFVIAIVAIVGISLVLSAVTIAIVQATTQAKKAWRFYPLAVIAWVVLIFGGTYLIAVIAK